MLRLIPILLLLASNRAFATLCGVALADFSGTLGNFSAQGLSRSQIRNRNAFYREKIPEMRLHPSRYHSLPRGIRSEFEPGFRELWKLMRQETRWFELLQEFEQDVATLARFHNVTLKDAFQQVLARLEKQYGFEKPVIVRSFLTNEAFLAIVNEGKPVKDEYYSGKVHTMEIHRIQSVLAARFLSRVFHDPYLYVRMYREMGDSSQYPQYSWNDTGVDVHKSLHPDDAKFIDLHGYLFDTPFFSRTHRQQANDYSNPLFFSSLRKYLPGLAGWE